MLSVKNLKVTYGRIAAITDVSFEVPEGKIVTLIGANGAGKTTTLRAVSGLEVPARRQRDPAGQGHHRLSRPPAGGPGHLPRARRPEDLPDPHGAGEPGAGRLGHQGQDKVKQRMEEVFEMLPRIKERIDQLGGTLSGGEQQMLAVGRAMVTGGDLMLLDEPSMGLAPVLVDEIFDKIVAINKKGTTVLLVEQNATEALEIADFAYVLEVGYTTISGPAKDIAADPRVREAYLGV